VCNICQMQKVVVGEWQSVYQNFDVVVLEEPLCTVFNDCEA
jgi:hypothetical protein